MSFIFNGREIYTDAEGFLLDKEQWTLELMYFLAKLEDVTLTAEHVFVIERVRNYFLEFDTTPAMRALIKYLKSSSMPHLASSVALARLFPQGAAKSACRYAGLPKPVKCI